ncbi:hypothetical protein FHR72_001132 [Mycolicibacterium iranicum]|uniref:Uncharacterized protein n=1 Tax=Mycolicibacterium iranicum TaxID=912594 RepID=A0A839Q1I2_MYCIR|nr:hypothetical protein [Mycolicibacterium iranicum]MBB2989669.1 hypothetical protein [Mycolicibacterium iranicum]
MGTGQMEAPDPLSAREKILVEGRDDWVKLWDVHRHVAEENSSASLLEVQRRTLELVRALVTERLAEIGDLRDHGAQFEPWTVGPDESMQRLAAQYVDHFDDRAGWPWTLWLRITDEGKRIGTIFEAAYQRWLTELREQDREFQALPDRFLPGS